MQFEKMIRVIQQGFFDVEELEKMEAKEVVKIDVLGSEMPLVYPFSNIDKSLAPIVD